MLDVQAGRRRSLADDPTYAALAQAIGPVVSAALLEGEQLRAPPTVQMSPEARAKLEEWLDLQSESLHRYDLVGFGYLDDGHDQTIVIALAYDDAEYAEADAPVLAERLENVPSLIMHEQILSDYWRVGEPEVHSFKGGSVLAIKLELDSEAPAGLWLNMLIRRDVVFLVDSE